MSEYSRVKVHRLGPVIDHPQADRLQITNVDNHQFVVQKGLWKEGDLAVVVFAAGDIICPKAYKLRGEITHGIIVPPRPDDVEGEDITEKWGFRKFFREETTMSGDEVSPPYWSFKYTDIENLKKYARCLVDCDEIIVTEKVDGSSIKCGVVDDTLWLDSMNRWIVNDGKNVWSKAIKGKIETILHDPRLKNLIVCGEVFGKVNRYTYGRKNGEISFVAYDIYDPIQGRYLHYDDFVYLCDILEIPRVPEFYRGKPLSLENYASLTERSSWVSYDKKDPVEGIVVKTTRETYHPTIGRCILKLHSNAYLIASGKTPNKLIKSVDEMISEILGQGWEIDAFAYSPDTNQYQLDIIRNDDFFVTAQDSVVECVREAHNKLVPKEEPANV